MLDDSSNRLIWIAVGLALIFGMFETYNGTIPKILESVTSTTQASIPVEHTAYAYSADGTDRFSTVYPNLNLLDGTRDFSGTWLNSSSWTNDGYYNGLTVKKCTGKVSGIYKPYKVITSGNYTFSTYIKSSGSGATIRRWVNINNVDGTGTIDFSSNFDWKKDSYTVNLKAGDTVFIRYEVFSDSPSATLWTAGFKVEQGSTATTWMPSASEVQDSDYPTYVGTYTDHNQSASNDPTKYSWKKR